MRGLLGAGALSGVQGTQPVEPPGKTADGKTFQDVLTDFVSQVDNSQKDYDAAITAVANGETDNLHQVMIAQSQAQLSLKLAVEVRNKLVEAYKEAMRTQF